MWVRARRRVPDVLPGLHIEAGERVLVEVSRKFTTECEWALCLSRVVEGVEGLTWQQGRQLHALLRSAWSL